MSHTTTRTKWSKIIEAWRESGLTQSEYCRHNGINVHTFRWRLGRLKQSQENTALVRIDAAKPESLNRIEILLSKSVRITVEKPCDTDLLVQVIKALETAL
jgi:hypothetical protein